MTRCLISIGSNQNEPLLQIETALDRITQNYEQVEISQLYLTEAVGQVAQADFINAVISLETNSSPGQLLEELLEIERRAGRDRVHDTPQGPRNLDLDIILFGAQIVNTETLLIPHPRFRERRFVMEPMAALAPDAIDPVSSKSIARLLAECPDRNWVKPLGHEVVAG